MDTNNKNDGVEKFNPDAPDFRARRRRWLPWAGVGAVVLIIVAGLWPRALPVEVAVVGRGALRVTINEEGQTRVRNRHIIASPVAGQLRRITLKPGDTVKASETVVAELETGVASLLDARSLAQAEAQVRAAESALAAATSRGQAAQATRKLAEAEQGRLRELVEKNLISAQEREVVDARATTALQEARAAMFSAQVAEFELEQARAALLRGSDGAQTGPTLVVKSPVDGRVLRVLQESARLVPGGAELIEVGDPADLEVRVEVLSRDGVAVAPGASMFLERWGGEGTLNARVRLVEPAAFTKISALGVEEQRVNLIADFTDSAERRAALGDGFRVEARIVTWQADDVLRVPAGALFQRDGGWRTFVVDGGRARLREVEIGRSNGVDTQVLAGLVEGDTVIVYPGDRVADGGRVRGLTVAR